MSTKNYPKTKIEYKINIVATEFKQEIFSDLLIGSIKAMRILGNDKGGVGNIEIFKDGKEMI